MENINQTNNPGNESVTADKYSEFTMANIRPDFIRSGQVQKNYKWLVIFVIGLVLGTLFVNYFMDASSLAIGEWKLSDVDKIIGLSSSTGFFIHILLKRAGIFIFLLGMTLLIHRSLLLYLSTAYYGFCFGVVISVMTVLYGFRGIWQLAGLLLPQYLLYVPAYVMLLKLTQESSFIKKGRQVTDIKTYVMPLLLIIVMVLTGCALESYVNPMWMNFLLKKF